MHLSGNGKYHAPIHPKLNIESPNLQIPTQPSSPPNTGPSSPRGKRSLYGSVLSLQAFIQNIMIEALDMFYLHTGANLG